MAGLIKTATVTEEIGSIKPYSNATAPSGWLNCDATAVSRTTFAGLFSIIGTSFGVGDGSTTFNLPDFRGAAPVGSGTSTGYTANETVALGTKYDDSMQAFRLGASTPYQHNDNGDGAGYALINCATFAGYLTHYGSPVTDGTHGTPRTGYSTKGKTVGVNYIIKY